MGQSVIAAILAGEITPVDPNLQFAALRHRTAQVVRNRSGVVGDNLARHLNRSFGRSFLGGLGLSTDSAPTLGWPALLIHGRSLTTDPIANSVLIAGLFDSIDDYQQALGSLSGTIDSAAKQPRPLIGARNIGLPMLRDALRLPTLHAVAREHNSNATQLKKWIAAYPGLSGRRHAHQSRGRLRDYKNAIAENLAAEPGRPRSEVSKTLKRAVAFVQRADRPWLDKVLPAQTELHGAVAHTRPDDSAAHDQAICDSLKEAIARAKAGRGRPIRYTLTRLISMAGLRNVSPNLRDQYPSTIEIAGQLSESLSDYYRRCLTWAAKNLIWQYGACDSLPELFVHARVGLEHVKPLTAFAQTLLTQGRLDGGGQP